MVDYFRSNFVITRQARMDVTALLCAKLLQDTQGDYQPMKNSLADLLSDPERMTGALLTLLNMLKQYATRSDTYPQGFQELTDYMLQQLKSMAN